MAQKLRDDKIGTLQHSAGNIQMIASLSNPAYLTIGGQQYKVTSTLVVALPAMTSLTRYQVYAVQSGGVVSLVISQNENSVGPAGYTRWKLIGSLMANGLTSVSFGSFINIKGAPMSLPVDFTPTGTHNNCTYTGKLTRNGAKADLNCLLSYTGTPTLTELHVNLPFTVNTTGFANTNFSGTNAPRVGWAELQETSFVFAELAMRSNTSLRVFRGSINPSAAVSVASATYTGFDGTYQNSNGSTLTMINGSRVILNVPGGLPVSGWTTTPIEDL